MSASSAAAGLNKSLSENLLGNPVPATVETRRKIAAVGEFISRGGLHEFCCRCSRRVGITWATAMKGKNPCSTASRCVGMVAMFAVLVLVFEMRAADWPQWRGPQRTGISSETGLVRDWPTEGPKLVWLSDKVGSGYSTPAVVGDSNLFARQPGMDDEFVKCLSTKRWQPNLVGANWQGGPQYSPRQTIPAPDRHQRLTAMCSTRWAPMAILPAWKRPAAKSVGRKMCAPILAASPATWAYAESPLVDGDMLVCTPGGAGGHDDRAEQEELGRDPFGNAAVPDGDPAAYSSVVILPAAAISSTCNCWESRHRRRRQNGKILVAVRQELRSRPANIPTPVVDGRMVYAVPKRLWRRVG